MSRNFITTFLSVLLCTACGDVLAEEYTVVISREGFSGGGEKRKQILVKKIDLPFTEKSKDTEIVFDLTYTLIISSCLHEGEKIICSEIIDSKKVSLFTTRDNNKVDYCRLFRSVALFRFNDSVIRAWGKGGLYSYYINIVPVD